MEGDHCAERCAAARELERDHAAEAVADGGKALRVCLSDLAAGGAQPFAYQLSLALPKDWREAWVSGFARGLAFVGDYAVVAMSKPRGNATFDGLALQANLEAQGAVAQCGLHVINTITGNAEQWVRIEGLADELYDVAVLPGVQRPMALGFRNDEVRRLTSVEPG